MNATPQNEPAKPGGSGAPTCSASLSMPLEKRTAVMDVIRKPRFLARLLREEAESAQGWSEAHADGLSWCPAAGGGWITKRESYAAKAAMLRAAADVFDPPNA